MEINAKGMHFAELDRLVKDSADENIVIDNVLGQRYIAAGAHGKHITINGIPGNALGAYLNDCTIEVNGNGQDAVGDTMNAGKIIIHGNCGDTAGYGMRDGGIFIRGYAGWRVGIHMKQYGTHIPKIVVGGTAGSYLGEYLAGGVIVVLGIGSEDKPCIGSEERTRRVTVPASSRTTCLSRSRCPASPISPSSNPSYASSARTSLTMRKRCSRTITSC